MADWMSLSNPIFSSYAFWACVLVLKMLAMSTLTGFTRFTRKAFANPEDLPSKKLKVKLDDPDVERVRRAHRNDLENIPILLLAEFLFMMTNPDPFIAINMFRAAALSRILHTIVYAIVVIPQPARAIAFFVPYVVTTYMAVFANDEDLPLAKGAKLKLDDPTVERIRRAHLNDLENILPLLAIEFLYLFTNPSAYIATTIFKVAAICRILHTIVYAVIVIPQPARAIAFFVPFLCCAYMVIQTMCHFW